MASGSLRELPFVLAVESDRIQMTLERRYLGGCVVDRARLRIDRFYARHHVRAARDLVDQLAIVVVAVDMLIPIAIGDPEELARAHRKRHEVLDARKEIEHVHVSLGL